MLSFTIPSAIKGKTIKKGRFTKLRILIDIRAYIAKLINNSDNVKYFMNIELGKAHSNPHIHIQLWIKKDNTSSNIIDLIKSKTIKKFNLISNRCFTTLPEHKIDVYHYVVKDYAKDLTDKQIWDLEVQKKRMRTQLGKKVRFYSKSTDMFSKKIYRIMYYTYGIVRDLANKYLISFLDNFFYFNKKNLPNIYSFCSCFSVLCYIEQEGNVLFISFILVLEVFSFAPGHDPPFNLTISILEIVHLYCKQKIYFKGVIMYMFYFIFINFVLEFVFSFDIRIRSPCYLFKNINLYYI